MFQFNSKTKTSYWLFQYSIISPGTKELIVSSPQLPIWRQIRRIFQSKLMKNITNVNQVQKCQE